MDSAPQLVLFAQAARNRIDQELTDIMDSLRLDGCPTGLLTLLSGDKRETNLIAQFEAVADLLAHEFSLKEVCQATGMSQPYLGRLLMVSKLPPALADGVKTGKIKRGVALQLLKLSKAELDRLSRIYQDQGALTGADVDALKQVRRQDAAQSLPQTMFEKVEIPGWNAPMDLGKEVSKLIEQFGFAQVQQSIQDAYLTLGMETHFVYDTAEPDHEPALA